MRVPNSPHSLKKVMATGKSSSSEGEDSDGTAALAGGSDGSGVNNIRPPRPKRNKSKDELACTETTAMNVDGDSGRRFARSPHISLRGISALGPCKKLWLMTAWQITMMEVNAEEARHFLAG